MRGTRFAVGCTTLLALMLSATPARASHYTVNAAGGADFTTITAAIQQHKLSARDSILVAPGSYADTLTFNSTVPVVTMIGTGGASVTSTASIVVVEDHVVNKAWRIEGVTFVGGASACYATDFRACRFLGNVTVSGVQFLLATSFHDCDFYGPSNEIAGFHGQVLERLHFHGAPVTFNSTGQLVTMFLVDCTFEGPADLLVHAASSYDDGVDFARCSFSNATTGVSTGFGCSLEHCTARDITGAAIAYEDAPGHSSAKADLSVSNCRFDRCGSAIRWVRFCDAQAYLTADTVYASTGNAIDVTENAPPRFISGYFNPDVMNGLIVDGGLGEGIVVREGPILKGVGIAHCRVSNVAGDGIHLVRAGYPDGSRIWDCRSDHNGGDGFHVEMPKCTIRGNIAWANGGDGFEFTPWEYLPDSVVSNTSVGNGGAGFRLVSRTNFPYRVAALVRNNLAVGNTGIGLIAPQHGSVAFNDVWNNAGGAYDGVASPADSNMVTNPLLCNLGAGDFGLQDGSPCAPSGPYGPIGARPVGCTSFAAAPPPAPTMAFTMRPNPARGSVEFAAPAGGGSVEVVDLQGRRVWAGALRAGETLRWDGSGVAGRVPPGIYLVRFRGAVGARTVRLAWIE